jgi:hypothetical protein
VALDDGTGKVRAELVPLFDLVAGMERPRVGILWLSRPHATPVLQAIARGKVPLTHEGIATLTPARTAIYVRDLLVSAAILAPVDRFLFPFEQTLPTWLAQIEDPDHRQLLHAYATWRLLRDLRAVATTGPVGHGRTQIARRRLGVAATFLQMLRTRDTDLGDCSQAVVDEWFAQATPSDAILLRHFIRWAAQTRRMPRLRLPPTKQSIPTPITHQQRLELLRRVHAGHGMELRERVAALLVLLYAQPLTKITRLTIDDITLTDQDQTLIRLGDPPAPVPPPFDDLIRRYLGARPNLTTATNPSSRWLFPGQRAGEPMHPATLRARLTKAGIPNLSSRTRALRAMLLQAPPAVVAGMLGYTPNKAEDIAREAGATWKHYAVGDHTCTRQPRIGT